MKSGLFARPNLKLLLLAAALLVCIQQFILEGRSQGPYPLGAMVVNARGGTNDELRALMHEATMRPNSKVYLRLCQYFEKRGDYRKAISYLRKAEEVAQFEDGAE